MMYTNNSMSVLSVRILEPGTQKKIFQSQRFFEKKERLSFPSFLQTDQ